MTKLINDDNHDNGPWVILGIFVIIDILCSKLIQNLGLENFRKIMI